MLGRKVIDNIGLSRLPEWSARVRIIRPHIYQPAEVKILEYIQACYMARGLEGVYKKLDETYLAYDETRKQPKFTPTPIDYKEMGARLLELHANSICRDIDAFTETRAKRWFNSNYPNDPTNQFCAFLMEYTWNLNVTLEAGNNFNSLKQSQEKCKCLIRLLNDLILKDVFTNETKNTDGINNIFQNIIVQYRAIQRVIEKKILILTAKDHFNTLDLQCRSAIDQITQTLMYLPSDIELAKNFSITKANSKDIVDPKQEEALNTRVGELMRVLLSTKEMSYLYPTDSTATSVSDTLLSLYNAKIHDLQSPTLTHQAKMRNAFVSNDNISSSYVAFLQGDDRRLQELSNSDPIARIYLSKLQKYTKYGIHKELRPLISKEIVEIYRLTNDLALCSIGVKLFLEKLVGTFGDFGAYVFGARLNEYLLSSLDTVSQKLVSSISDVQLAISDQYMNIKRNTHYPPSWKNTFAYHQALMDSSIQHLQGLTEQVKIIQTELYRLTTEQRIQEFRNGMRVLQGIFGDIALRIIPHSLGLTNLGLGSNLPSPGILYLNQPAVLENGASTLSEREELKIEEISVVVDEDVVNNEVESCLDTVSCVLQQFLKEYNEEKWLVTTCITAFSKLDSSLIDSLINSSTPSHHYKVVAEIIPIMDKLIKLRTEQTQPILTNKLEKWQDKIQKESIGIELLK